MIVRLIDTATGVALLSGILHPTTVVNTVTHVHLYMTVNLNIDLD